MTKIKGKIVLEDVTHLAVHGKQVRLITKSYEKIDLPDYFRPYVGNKITIKIK